VEIPLKKMYPSYRGRKLDRPNFNEGYLEEMAFLIANKKAEEFKLLLDKIEVK
jgi:NADH dehydrogenase [ubiquinone] 1 alpha subcomplex assembly factor 1